MLKAIIVDFNGVIIDDEPLHFSAMREAVADFGIELSRQAYWDRYLPMDDAQCLDAICKDYLVDLGALEREKILKRKVDIYRRLLQDRLPLFPGAAQFVINAAKHFPLALASGARRREIETVLSSAELIQCFDVIVAAEDFVRGKPHPDSFLLALSRLNEKLGRLSDPIRPGECLVVEDSVAGIKGAKAAGMVCLAVTNSYPSHLLQAADKVVASLEEVQIHALQELFKNFP